MPLLPLHPKAISLDCYNVIALGYQDHGHTCLDGVRVATPPGQHVPTQLQQSWLLDLCKGCVVAGKPRTELPYHVRVIVPCYKESLEILRRTIMAAYDADLPRGCSRTIYLCDDGKDPKKRKWCDTMGPEVQYVSGRKRASGEMNGKSGNLNNVVAQMYPEVRLQQKLLKRKRSCVSSNSRECSSSLTSADHVYDASNAFMFSAARHMSAAGKRKCSRGSVLQTMAGS